MNPDPQWYAAQEMRRKAELEAECNCEETFSLPPDSDGYDVDRFELRDLAPLTWTILFLVILVAFLVVV